MEDYFKDMVQMGVAAIRTWGISVEEGSGEFEALVTGPYSYNETVFRRVDKMLELCNKYNIRVILCLVKKMNSGEEQVLLASYRAEEIILKFLM